MTLRINPLVRLTLLSLALVALTGCVYYNTFYNARKAFNEAEKTRKQSRFKTQRIKADLYQLAIDKSMKVVENYPNSKYFDDALYVLGVSYFYTKKYGSSERRLRELLANYPESKYVDEAQLYLAKAKLELREEEEAMDLFQIVFEHNSPKEFKVEAALALGNFYYDNREYAKSLPYFAAVRDSLGETHESRAAQRLIADALYEDFKFREAIDAYRRLLNMEPDNDEKYHALYNSALSSFMLMRIDEGQQYLSTLANDQLYFDSLGVIKLRMAEGYEYVEDNNQAEIIYQQVLDQEEKPAVASEAAYRLGLIYQFDNDDLPKAKEYYDRSVKLDRMSDFSKDALQRSSDIGKIETFKLALELDSTASEAMIDEAAATQYSLAELYWLKLNKPDSAIIEMRYVIDSFPRSASAPKALIALSQMLIEQGKDSARARQWLEFVPKYYPHSDYVPEALEVLGLLGTEADTGYAEIYLRKAEHFVTEDENADSARYYYQYIIDHFPRSRYFSQAKFSLIYLDDKYDPPGDSSLIFAYNEFIDSFPNSGWAKEAEARMGIDRPKAVATTVRSDSTEASSRREDDDIFRGFADEQDTAVAEDYLVTTYIGPGGEKIANINLEPTEIRDEFEYPVEAYRSRWEGDLYFQIFLDFSGEVTDHILKVRCDIEEINEEASRTVASMIFDALRVPPEQQDSWMVYKFQVRIPDHLR